MIGREEDNTTKETLKYLGDIRVTGYWLGAGRLARTITKIPTSITMAMRTPKAISTPIITLLSRFFPLLLITKGSEEVDVLWGGF